MQKIKQLILLLIIYIISNGSLLGQYQISGLLIDSNDQHLEFANIVLSLSSDSSFVGGTTSEIGGRFELQINKPNTFDITISVLGYESKTISQIKLSEKEQTKDLGIIELSEGGVQLDEVEVLAKRPIIEQKIDRTIINLDNRVSTTGASALEVLEQSPGVVVSRSSSSIGMLSKDGVNVMINGKLNYMPNNALLDFLGAMDANNISKIELITTPPASLDAQGNAGYINIILKRSIDDGLKGSYALTGGYGRGILGNASINLNYRKDKINLYGNYAYTRNDQKQFTSLDRTFGNLNTNLTSDREPIRNNQNARIGLVYQISDQTTIGSLISGYSNKWDMNAVNTVLENGLTETTLISNNLENNDWHHLQANFNFSHQFSNGGQLSTDFDYLGYKNENPTSYRQSIRDQVGTLILDQNLFSTKTTPFNIRVAQMDYTVPFSENIKISLGGKYVLSNFENDVLVEENDLVLPKFTSESDLNENVKAIYSEVDYQLSSKLRLKGGLRYEDTDTELNSTNGGKIIDRQFGGFFPSLFLNYKINSTNQLNLSYSKRINRPSFSDMAPFIIFLSPNTSFGGNAALQPAIANTLQANYRYKTVNFSVQYTKEDSTIVRFQNQFDPTAGTQLIIPDNLSEQKTFSASVAFPLKINEWWNMRLFGIYTRQTAISINENRIQDFNQNNFRLSGSQSLKLASDLNIELSGFYQSTRLNGNVRFKPQGILNFGIQKKLNSQSRLSFNVSDVFNSLKAIGETDLQQDNIFVSRTFDFSQRTFKMTYSKTFGNQKVKNNRNRTSSNDERKRVN